MRTWCGELTKFDPGMSRELKLSGSHHPTVASIRRIHGRHLLQTIPNGDRVIGSPRWSQSAAVFVSICTMARIDPGLPRQSEMGVLST